MIAKHYNFIPHFTAMTCKGQARLDILQEQSELMTASASELRDEGYKKITLEQIIRRTQEHRPSFAADPNFFRFTGKRVVVSEGAFTAWYGGTEEGRAVLADNDLAAPGVGLRFASIQRK